MPKVQTTIVLIRHGETEWNKNSRWQGQLDIPLSETGLEQARRLATRLKDEEKRFHTLYSSDLCRAFKTAQLVAEAVGGEPLPRKELREIDVGKWSGLYTHELETKFPEDYRRMHAGEDIRRGGAESMAMVYERVKAFIGMVLDRHAGQDVAIVTHNGVIKAALMLMKNLTVAQAKAIGLMQNCSLTIAVHEKSTWDVRCLNDAKHLEGVTGLVPEAL